MLCPNCSGMVEIDAAFCPHCGHQLQGEKKPYVINWTRPPRSAQSENAQQVVQEYPLNPPNGAPPAPSDTIQTPASTSSATSSVPPPPRSANVDVADTARAAFNSTRDGFKTATETLTQKLGLEKIEGFSLSAFFGGVFKKRSTEEIENYLSLGFLGSTPKLNSSMTQMPNPWLFFRMLVGSLIAYLVFYITYKQFPQNLNIVPGLIVTGSFAIPFSVVILFFELNTPRNVSLVRLTQMLILGGGISLLITLILFAIFPFLLKMLGASSAGLIEETAKLGTVILLTKLPTFSTSRYRYAINGLLFGAVVGAGFAAFESAGYALRIGLQGSLRDGGEEMLNNIFLRGVLSPFGHIIWTAISACAFWRIRVHHTSIWNTLKDKRFLMLLLVPMTLHFTWNLPFAGPLLAKYWVLGFIGWAVVISLTQSCLKELRNDPDMQESE